MIETNSGLNEAEARVEQAQGALDAIGRVLQMAEKTQAAAERARTAVRSGNMLVFAGFAALGVLLLIKGKHRS